MQPLKTGQTIFPQPPAVSQKAQHQEKILPGAKTQHQEKNQHVSHKKTAFAQVLHQTQTGQQVQAGQQAQTEHGTQQVDKGSLKYSQHAEQRLADRGIELNFAQMERLEEGVEKARQKGAQQSLLLMENLAFVVSVKNNTVITAMEHEGMTEQVFTNIDSAVLI